MKLSGANRSLLIKRVLLIAVLLILAAGMIYAQEGGAEAKGGLPEPGAIWRWLNFLILAGGLGYLLGKSLPSFFKSRSESIRRGIEESQAIKADAERRAAEVEAKIKSLGAEIERLKVQSKQEMQQEGERIRQETAQQIRRLESQAEQEIEAAGKHAMRDLKNFASKLALDLAEQRIRNRMDDRTETGLVNGFIQDLNSSNGRGSRN